MNRHRLDLVSLVAGLATVAVAVTLLIPDIDTISLGRLLPAGIIALGVALLLSGRGSDRAVAEDAPTTGDGRSTPQPLPPDPGSSAPDRAGDHDVEPLQTDDARSAATHEPDPARPGDETHPTRPGDETHPTRPGDDVPPASTRRIRRPGEEAPTPSDEATTPQDVTRRLDDGQTDRRE